MNLLMSAALQPPVTSTLLELKYLAHQLILEQLQPMAFP